MNEQTEFQLIEIAVLLYTHALFIKAVEFNNSNQVNRSGFFYEHTLVLFDGKSMQLENG